MPSLVFGLLFFGVPQATSIPESFKERLFYLIVSSTLIIPIVLMVGLRWTGMVKSLHFEEVGDRKMPFILVTLFLCADYLFFKAEDRVRSHFMARDGDHYCVGGFVDWSHFFFGKCLLI